MGYDLTVTGPRTRALFDLRGDRAALGAALAAADLPGWPDRPNSRRAAGGAEVLWLGPAQGLLMAPLDREAGIEAALAGIAGVTLVSDTLAFFTLSGADAGVAMAIGCPLDLHPTSFPDDGATFTEAFGTRALVLRDAAGWLLAVDRSYADYVAAHLSRIAG